MAFGFLLALWAGSQVGMLLFASMGLHVLGDLPLHHDDGHHHDLEGYEHHALIA